MMQTKKYDPRIKALLMAIPLGLVAGIITQLLAMWSAGNYPSEGWPDLSLGLIIGLGLSRVFYHKWCQGNIPSDKDSKE